MGISEKTGNVEEQGERSTDLIKFDLERVSLSLFEAGKSLTKAASGFAVLVATAAIVTLGSPTETDAVGDVVKIPLIGLQMDRITASEVILVICALAFGRLLLLRSVHGLIGLKLRQLRIYLDDNNAKGRWAIYYPSVAVYARYGRAFGRLGGLPWLVINRGLFLVSTAGLVPLYLMYRILEQTDWAWHAWVPITVWILVHIVIMLVSKSFVGSPTTKEDIKKVIDIVEKHEDKLLSRYDL